MYQFEFGVRSRADYEPGEDMQAFYEDLNHKMHKLDYYKEMQVIMENEIKHMLKGTPFGFIADNHVEVDSKAISSSLRDEWAHLHK